MEGDYCPCSDESVLIWSVDPIMPNRMLSVQLVQGSNRSMTSQAIIVQEKTSAGTWERCKGGH